MIEDIEDAITLSMNEASMKAEIEENERRLKWAWNVIENRDKKQAKKQAGYQEETKMEFNFKTVLMIVMAMIKVLAKNVRIDEVSNTVATIKIANTKANQQIIDVLYEQVVNYLSTVELPYGERLSASDTWIENGWIKFDISSYWINSNKVVD